MKRAFHFLGSVYCALILIALTAFLTILGTIMESKTGSHLAAEFYFYKNPVFIILLAFFFINILFSALRRWPFKTKHIPFLITHLGLLMIIAGVYYKANYGLQGVVSILEGSGSDEILLPNTYAVRVEKKGNDRAVYYGITQENPIFKMIKYAPHSNEGYASWIKDQGSIAGLPPFPVYAWEVGEPLPKSGKVQMEPNHVWDLIALKTEDSNLVADALDNASLALIKDNQTTTIISKDRNGVIYQQLPGSIAVYDEGFGGYRAIAKIPILDNKLDEIIDLPYPLQLLSDACKKGNIEFSQCCVEFLSLCQKNLLVTTPNPSLEKAMVYLNDAEYKDGADWVCQVFRSIDPEKGAQQALLESGWPLSVKGASDDEIWCLAAYQIFSIAERLPPPPESSPSERFSALLMAYGITFDHIPFEKKEIILESILLPDHQPAPPLPKSEDNIPLISLKVKNENIDLVYSKTGTGLPWPAGNYLFRFQPAIAKLPFHIRVRNARKICYSNTDQPYSYECDILINQSIEATLSMNKVYETEDGTRIYLSGISPGDETEVKRVHLVINRDPAKYILTYPGGAFVSLGIIMLFWFRPNAKILPF